MKIKKIAITGSTGGLGERICNVLAKNGYDLVLVDRNPEKSRKNAERIKNKFPSVNIESVVCDLEKIESVKDAADKLKNIGIDALVLNAGIYNVPLRKCDSGYNNVFQVNFISQYYLARKLAETAPPLKKVIAMSSVAHDFSKTDLKDVDFSTRSSQAKIYGNSKRYLTFSLFELFERVLDVKLCVVHPGVTLTNMTNHYPKAINWLVKIGIKLFFPSPEKAIRCVKKALGEDCARLEWIGPSVFNVWGKPKKSVLKTATEEEIKTIASVAETIYHNINDQKTRL